jgi:hypothetical protein
MAAPRRVIALLSDAAHPQQLQEIAGSRTAPASRVERARSLPDTLNGRPNWGDLSRGPMQCQGSPSQSGIHRVSQARDHGLARRVAPGPLYLHLHPDPWVLAQSDRGLFLQTRALGAPADPRHLETPTQAAPDGLHRRPQSRANPPHLELQNRQGSLIA